MFVLFNILQRSFHKHIILLDTTFCSRSFSFTALIHVKLYFLDSALLNLGLFLATYICSGYFTERNIVVFFVVLHMMALSLLIRLVLSWDHSYFSQYYILLFYILLGSPFLIPSQCCSLLSRITDPRNAGFFQGCSVATMNFAYALTRLSMSFVFTRAGMIYFSFTVIAFWFISAVWYFFTYRNLTVQGNFLRINDS